MNVKKKAIEQGELRQNEVVDILRTIYQQSGQEVLLYNMKHSLLSKVTRRPQGDRFYVLYKGVTIINRLANRPIDIMVYKDGQLWSLWEITNYDKATYMPLYKFKNYIDNLTSPKGNTEYHKFLVISYLENLRRLFPERSDEYNIEWAQKELARNKIFLIVWEMTHLKENIEAWIKVVNG